MRRWLFAFVAGTLALGGLAGSGAAHHESSRGEEHRMGHGDEMVFVESRFSYAETVKRLKVAIRARGMQVMFVDDQQATLRKVGVKSVGAAVIEFFNTEYTKRIFEIDHAAHMAIPLRIGVMEGSEHDPHSKATHVMYDKPSALLVRYHGLEAVASELDGILEKIVAAVGAEGGMKMEGDRPEHKPGQTGKPSH